MNARNDLQSWLDVLTADTEIVIDDDALTLVTVDHDRASTVTRCEITGYDDYDRYKHLIAVAYRRGPDWTPDAQQSRILAEGWSDGYAALQAFAAGQPVQHIEPQALAADIAALLDMLELSRDDWPHEGEPGPQIAGVRALQRHIAQYLPHDPSHEAGR
ncbi:hypothetical protein [Nocardia amamiensis]|uniref:hypothetical protein n=1 Tax=Nocardia amamiensis TaxID=404578 RepID=UPI00083222DE|nr:hypothetical protein [Nocardia amamiensis]